MALRLLLDKSDGMDILFPPDSTTAFDVRLSDCDVEPSDSSSELVPLDSDTNAFSFMPFSRIPPFCALACFLMEQEALLLELEALELEELDELEVDELDELEVDELDELELDELEELELDDLLLKSKVLSDSICVGLYLFRFCSPLILVSKLLHYQIVLS